LNATNHLAMLHGVLVLISISPLPGAIAQRSAATRAAALEDG
jgi:hypothetical protein